MSQHLITLLIGVVYVFIAVAYSRYIYLRHTWKFTSGDETPSAFVFGAFWPVSMLVQFALFLGSYAHYNTPKKD